MMALDHHRQAEELMGEAERELAVGNQESAARNYRQAAELETQAFQQIGDGKPRTRGVLALSAVALFRKAGAAADAMRSAHYFLGLGTLPAFAQEEITVALLELYGEKQDGAQRQLGPDTFEWVLRGPRVGIGIAPAETVIEAISHASKFGLRVFEYLAGIPLRVSGPPLPSVIAAFGMQISEPQAGSFKFRMRLGAPSQTELFDEQRPVDADDLGHAFASILDAITTADDGTLAAVVADPTYQIAFRRLVRLLAPDGKTITEVEVRRRKGHDVESTTLLPSVRSTIDRQLRAARPPRPAETDRRGVLRGLHLDEGWIALGSGQGQRCYVDQGAVVLEDVAGELVNRSVRVAGHFQGKRFMFTDITEDLDTPAPG